MQKLIFNNEEKTEREQLIEKGTFSCWEISFNLIFHSSHLFSKSTDNRDLLEKVTNTIERFLWI